MLHAGERFRVPHKQVPSRFQACAQAFHNILLRCFVEIHHYVPAEDHVKEAPVRERLYEVEPLERYPADDLRLELAESLTLAVAAQQIRFPPVVWQVAEAFSFVDAAFCDSEHACGDVRGQDSEVALLFARSSQSVD